MLVPMTDVTNGITAYVRNDVLPHLPTDGVKGFGIGVAAALAVNRIEHLVKQLIDMPIVALLGVVDENEMVDVDALREAALQAMPDDGISFQIGNQHKITFGSDDVNKLYKFITR